MIDRYIADNKNYKKIFRTTFLYRKSEKLEEGRAVDLRKGRGCGSVPFSRKIEFDYQFVELTVIFLLSH